MLVTTFSILFYLFFIYLLIYFYKTEYKKIEKNSVWFLCLYWKSVLEREKKRKERERKTV